MHRFLPLVVALSILGCGLSHERSEAGVPITPDGGLLVPDTRPFEPDVFVPPHDAWTPPFTTAPHGSFPIIPDQGGLRIRHPQLVLIFYADDPNAGPLEMHANWVMSSSWLATVGADYGVGNGTVLGVVHRMESAPSNTTGPNIETYLRNGIASHTLPVPTAGSTSDVIYVHYFPGWTTITDDLTGTSCQTHAGYHNSTTTADGQPLVYAVIPTCGSFNPLLSDLEDEEVSITHELIEAATDAQPVTGQPAWVMNPNVPPYSPWLFAGAETADLCEYRTGTLNFVREGGFVATRVWSNSVAARADGDPCIPVDTSVPFETVDIVPNEATAASPGDTVTFDLTGWSTAPMAPMNVQAFGSDPGMTGTFVASPQLSTSVMTNGTHATLTVTVPLGTPSQAYSLSYVMITYANGDTDYLPVVVYTP